MSYLPAWKMTKQQQRETDLLFLDFLTSLYIAAKKLHIKTTDVNVWFLQEIAYHLAILYPEKPNKELEDILVHIIDQARLR